MSPACLQHDFSLGCIQVSGVLVKQNVVHDSPVQGVAEALSIGHKASFGVQVARFGEIVAFGLATSVGVATFVKLGLSRTKSAT